MTAYEIFFRVKHSGTLTKLTELNPSMSMYTWCNKVNEVIEVRVNDPKEYSSVISEVSKVATVLDESPSLGEAHIIVCTCFCTPQNSVEMNIEGLSILVISPEITKNGWEYYRIIVYKHEDLSEMIKRLIDHGFVFEILEKTEFKGSLASSLLATDTLFSTLTNKQREALLKAHRYGYYELPRVTDIQEIARLERLKRTTFQEHLKKGENRLIGALVPYMQLYLSHADRGTN